jgi:hypothetical protein
MNFVIDNQNEGKDLVFGKKIPRLGSRQVLCGYMMTKCKTKDKLFF